MKPFNKHMLGLCIAAVLAGASSTASAASQTDIDQLLSQGHYWYEQGRPDFSAEAWRKVLLIDPDNAEAKKALEELNAAQVEAVDKALLEKARKTARRGKPRQALNLYQRAFAASDGKPPSSFLAAEYYLTMAGTPEGWQTARQELERLTRLYPSSKRYQYMLATALTFQEPTRIQGIKMLQALRDDPTIGREARRAWLEAVSWLGGSDDNWTSVHNELSTLHQRYPDIDEYTFPLAKLKTYREATRRDGIRMLEVLAEKPKFAREAVEAWRQALLWLNATQAERDLYDAFLKKHPGDNEIIAKRQALPAPPPTEEELRAAEARQRAAERRARLARKRAAHGRKIQQGYQLLDQELSDEAIAQFQRLLEHNPRDAEALKGLGIAHLRLQNFKEAERYLSLAIEAAPRRNADLQQPLEEARFWAIFSDASWAYKQGETDKARDLALQALAMRPDHPDTLLLLARIAAGEKDNATAKQYFEQVLAVQPDNRDAQEGLAGALAGMGDMEAAGRIIHRYNLPDSDYLSYRNMVEAAALRAEAGQARSNEEAIKLLTRAQRLQPQDPWIRLDLARHYRKAGRPKIALSLLDQLISMYPNYPEAYHAKALYHAQFNELFEGLVALESIPPAYRNKREAALYREVYRQLWIKQKKLEADQLVAIGDYGAVRDIIDTMKIVEQSDPSAMLIRAELLADIGDVNEAMKIVNQVKTLSTPDDIAFKTQLATVLLKARETDMLESVLADLEARKDSMDFAQQDDLAHLKLGVSLQKADDLRKQRRYKEALAVLEPMRKRFEKNLELKLSRATIYKESGQHDKAQKLYREILFADPNYRAAYAGLAGSLMEQARFTKAREVVDKGLRTVLEAPELLALRGKLKLLKGDYNGAAQDLQQSLFDDYDDRTYNSPETGSGGGDTLGNARPGSWQFEARKDLRRLNNRKLNNVLGGVGLRQRDGDEGIDKLTEVSVPLLMKNYRDYQSASGLSVRAVSVDAGTARPEVGAPNRIGALVLARESDDPRERDPVINNAYSFSDLGIGVNGFIQGRNYKLDLGVTPIGFRINTLLGGLHWQHRSYRSRFGAHVTRRAVKDSLLSYAGLKDPDTKQEWGAVAKTGFNFDFTLGDEKAGFYGDLGAHIYDGQAVADNSSAEAKAGFYFKLFDNGSTRFTTGLNGRWMAYEKNLNFFTLGHGGYFSPQQYVNVSLPLDFQMDRGPLSLRLGADLGQQKFRTDAVDVFPIDPPLQTRLQEIHDTVNSAVRTQYDAEDKNEFVYNIHAELEYAIGRQYALGGWLSGTDVNDFREFQAGIFLRRYQLPRTDIFPQHRDDVEDRLHALW